jgi:uncharacterized delta-60 repeat protein
MSRSNTSNSSVHNQHPSVFLGLRALLCFLCYLLWISGVALAQPGSIDTTFHPGAGVDSSVFAIAVQPDGKILIGGDFTTVASEPRGGIARLDSIGGLDTTFDPGTGADDLVSTIALQGNNVIIGGYFLVVDGATVNGIARLTSSGALDNGFNSGDGADDAVNAVAMQEDGKVLLGGAFTTLDSVSRNNIGRLRSAGPLDNTFDPGTGVSAGALFSSVRALALQTNGSVVIGGSFTEVDGASHHHIARLDTNGAVDATFNAAVSVAGAGILAGVHAIAVQSDGKIVIGGDFTGVNGVARTNIARLNSNGTLDTSFNPPGGADALVASVAVQSNGKIVLGGFFTTVNGVSRNYIARLNSDGTLDTGFDPGSGASDAVYAVRLQEDGKVLVGGLFTTMGGAPRAGIARLEGDSVTVEPPRMQNPVRGAGTFSVSVATVSGKTYVLEYNDTLSSNGWTALPGVPGDGTVKVLQDANATAEQRFYRVRVD